MTDYETPEWIVTALADMVEPLDNHYGYCALCKGKGKHTPLCPWQLARSWKLRNERFQSRLGEVLARFEREEQDSERTNMALVHVETIYGEGYIVDEKAFVLESDQADEPGYLAGVRLTDDSGRNVFIPYHNIDRIVWNVATYDQ